MSDKVRQILSYYESENPGVKANLARILMHGKLGGTGKLVILPVDQGFEHGPIKSFEVNPDAYDPHYHFQLAVDSGVSAYAAPLGMIEAGVSTYAGMLPLILKLNSSNSLHSRSLSSDQAITASVKDALRLGCTAVGFTIYPGSAKCFDMIEEACEIIAEAKSCGLAVVLWSYPRGEGISKVGETAVDVISYAAHVAALLGANIIKVKLPTTHLEKEKIKAENIQSLSKRIEYVRKSCFAGKRILVFSGGETKSVNDICSEAKEIKQGGGNGSIIGRNSFQRKREEALSMLKDIMDIYA
ncbi:class I fructose-bisphosphate aldolase [Wolbachia endosymbiont of Dirofilaria (Dirofilaria) immitis]|uniref:class I fructose-bisphosphate aldolase n=1 Tax=Wolbachia endosymbiont of Dirofilaria (Dirofilaria) immitis TaxID=1812115 RepID=UPI0015883F37|nr:class I fructose-bisphosphate aldolase [Wolbachia endosymbiont of Dirofilaria (Dirofilaria) immitis]QKX02029.1 class I fructose-bisphosphate aldolase [Wolbachia endosymbiont of Dirofilaria (Dirofilaria) immitis]